MSTSERLWRGADGRWGTTRPATSIVSVSRWPGYMLRMRTGDLVGMETLQGSEWRLGGVLWEMWTKLKLSKKDLLSTERDPRVDVSHISEGGSFYPQGSTGSKCYLRSVSTPVILCAFLELALHIYLSVDYLLECSLLESRDCFFIFVCSKVLKTMCSSEQPL